ncbi:MAG: chain-length determining protein [Prevotella sp.]|nr:chain-length determining protein [Prevotella sp.]
MEEENKNIQNDVIDLRVIVGKVRKRKRLFLKVLPTAFVLSCLFIICFPRYYITDAKLAPEIDNNTTGGTLSSLASSFGIDLGQIQTTDAISPLLYPDLMDDNGFVASLFEIKVKSADGEINTNYHDYLAKYQEYPWWEYPIEWIRKMLPKSPQGGSASGYDPYYLSRREDGIMGVARDNIQFSIDKKTDVITISVTAQDALIAKTMADSVTKRLQWFITDYRTNKARVDYEYYKQLASEAKQEYERTRQRYASMSDANTNIAMRSVELKLEDMENDMQLKFNAYTALSTQLQAAKAKVQERTPAFTIIKGASVPVKPTGPKRMLFVLGMIFLAFFGTIAYIIKDEILEPFKQA